MLSRMRLSAARLSENTVLRVLWYLALMLLSIFAYQGMVPFVYARF